MKRYDAIRRLFSLAVAVIMVCTLTSVAFAAAPAEGSYEYDRPGDRNFTSNSTVTIRTGPNGEQGNSEVAGNQSYKVETPRAQAKAAFTAEAITVDGKWKDAYAAATPVELKTARPSGLRSNDVPEGAPEGKAWFLWDGPRLYILVEVSGDATAATDRSQGWISNELRPTEANDGLVVGLDVFNDKMGNENDTTTYFYIQEGGALKINPANAGIPALGSFLHPASMYYAPRVTEDGVKGTAYNAEDNREGVNYTYEMCIDIEGWGDVWDHELENGAQVGIELAIMDENKSFTFWSRQSVWDNGVNNEGTFEGNMWGTKWGFHAEKPQNFSFGEVTLDGWNGTDEFAYSNFKGMQDYRWWTSLNNPGVLTADFAGGDEDLGARSKFWTAESKARMMDAITAWDEVKEDVPANAEERAALDAAQLEVCEAFTALRWADTTFPDPRDMPSNPTIPSPYDFFNYKGDYGDYDVDTNYNGDALGENGYDAGDENQNGKVDSIEEWDARKAEILAMGEFYEYGYKPQLGRDYTVAVNSVTYAGTGNAVLNATITPTGTGRWRGGEAVTTNITVTNPAAAKELAGGGKAGLGFGLTTNGFASVSTITTIGDTRANSIWGVGNNGTESYANAGNFGTLFPHNRNTPGLNVQVGYPMQTAAAATISLDIIEAALAMKDTDEAAKLLDETVTMEKIGTSGASIGGKIAWLRAAYDERVTLAIPGVAGANGPQSWRYSANGQEFNLSGTIYEADGSEAYTAYDVEGPGNAWGHNRQRLTEKYRFFMDIGNAFKIYEGNYAYGKFDRSPYDPVLLTATFAPDRYIILSTQPNDFRDGAVGDNLSFQLAASVFKAFGANPDEHVFYASSNYISTGDPHGGRVGRIDTAMLAAHILHGTEALSDEDMERALTDPYNLKVTGPDFGQVMSAYDYYWGGFNTITGGKDGIDGTDGWYYTEQFPDRLPEGPYVTMNGPAGAEISKKATYRVSAANMQKLATATFWFEVEDKYLFGIDFKGLNGFGMIGGVQWTKNGDNWIGRATVGAMNGGADLTKAKDIFEMTYDVKDAVGVTEAVLTKMQLSGYNEAGEAVYIEEIAVVNDSVSTVVDYAFGKYDINRDGKTDQLDLTTAQLYYTAEEGDRNWDEAARADVSGNGEVGIEDFIEILNNIEWEPLA